MPSILKPNHQVTVGVIDGDGTRIVTVGGLPCPCGGTHVASAGAIGAVKVEAVKKKGSGKKAALRVSYSMAES